MKKRIAVHIAVHGVTATAPRPTKAAAMLLACALSVPVFVFLNLIGWLFRQVG